MIASFLNPWTISRICAGSFGDVTETEFVSGNRRLTASVPSEELWGSIKDVLVYEEYELMSPFSCANMTGGLIVDIGAQVGLYTLKAAPFAGRVISFEPSAKNFSFLKANVDRNSLPNVQLHQQALWSSKGRVKFTDGGAGFVSVLGGSGVGYEVETTTLDEVILEAGEVSLLKMDIEGAEYDVFLSCRESSLRHVEKIVAEVHVYAPAHAGQFGSLVQRLKNSGFTTIIQNVPFQNSARGLAKPWRAPLKRCNGRNAIPYRALLSAVYGGAPFLGPLKKSIDIGTQSLLFAYRN